MKLKTLILKNKTKLIFLCLICICIFLAYFATNFKVMPYQTYNGLDANVIGQLNDSEKNGNREEVLGSIPSVVKVDLKDEDILKQQLLLNAITWDEISVDVKSYGESSSMQIEVIDMDNKSLYQEDVVVTSGTTKIKIEMNSKKYDKTSIFTLKMKVHNPDKSSGVSVYGYSNPNGGLEINKSTKDVILLANIVGTINVYKEKTLCILLVFAIMLMTALICLAIKDKNKAGVMIEKILSKCQKKIWIFTSETLLYLGLLYVFLMFFTSYIYKQSVNLVFMYLFIFILSIFIVFMIEMFKRLKNDLSMLFVLLAIPIGLSFVFFMLPDHVPDEHAHFAKAYLTSQLSLSATNEVIISSQYMPFKLNNYNDVLPAIFQFGNYDNGTLQVHACQYNAILYIFSSSGILLARLFNLSVYVGYYLGRSLNLFAYIYVGYKCIRMIPIGKYVFLVYMLNPMALQQAASFSMDAITNSILLFAIAFFLKLKFSKDNISTKQIFIIFSLIGLMLVAKYAYLPIFAIYFLLYEKISKLELKQWGFTALSVVGVAGFYLLMNKLAGKPGTSKVIDAYLLSQGVNPHEQIQLMLANPKSALKMLSTTFQVKGDFYYQTFIGKFAWLRIPLNSGFMNLYAVTMLVSPMIVEEKEELKWYEKFWFILVALLSLCLVILGLYIMWTGVGQAVAEGIQGRYFIPIILLILLSYAGKKRVIIKNPTLTLTIILILVSVVSINDIINYFIFLN